MTTETANYRPDRILTFSDPATARVVARALRRDHWGPIQRGAHIRTVAPDFAIRQRTNLAYSVNVPGSVTFFKEPAHD